MKKIRIGLIGSGKMQQFHVDFLNRNKNFAVTAVAAGRRAPALAKSCKAAFCPTVKDLCKRNDVDLVIIATPPALHEEHATIAARYGKHILLEKPMAINVATCRRILKATRKAKVKLMIGHSLRWFPACRKGKDLLSKKYLGRIHCLRLAQHRGCPDMVLMHRHNPKDWHFDPKIGGRGMAIGYGVHSIDRVLWYSGRKPVKVFASFSNPFIPKVPIEFVGMIHITFDDGSYGQVWFQNHSEAEKFEHTSSSMEVLCENGHMHVDAHKACKVSYNRKPWKTIMADPNRRVHFDAAPVMLQDIEKYIRNGGPSPVSGEEGALAVAVVEAAYKSADTGKAVKVDTKGLWKAKR